MRSCPTNELLDNLRSILRLLLFVSYAFNTFEMFILSPQGRITGTCGREDDTVCHRQLSLIGYVSCMHSNLSIEINDRTKRHNSHRVQCPFLPKLLEHSFKNLI